LLCAVKSRRHPLVEHVADRLDPSSYILSGSSLGEHLVCMLVDVGAEAPACIIAGNDRIHAPATARKLASLIPNCEFHDDVVAKRPDNELLDEWNKQEWRDAEPCMLEIFTSFLARQGGR
jgi:hypothetical protein